MKQHEKENDKKCDLNNQTNFFCPPNLKVQDSTNKPCLDRKINPTKRGESFFFHTQVTLSYFVQTFSNFIKKYHKLKEFFFFPEKYTSENVEIFFQRIYSTGKELWKKNADSCFLKNFLTLRDCLNVSCTVQPSTEPPIIREIFRALCVRPKHWPAS